MERVKNVFLEIFSGIKIGYMVKTYIFGLLVLLIFLSTTTTDTTLLFYAYCFLSFLLFPFATILWDDLMNVVMANNMIVMPIAVMMIWKLIKLILLFALTLLIAPIGMAYVFFANRRDDVRQGDDI